MTDMRPTPNQKGVEQGRENRARIVEYVVQYLAEHGYPPTRVEIAKGVGLGETITYRHVRTLINEGVLEEPHGVGSLRLKE